MIQPTRPLRLHRHPLSGHSHRVELFLSLLGLPYELVDVDLGARAHKSPGFLAMNRFGQLPVLQDGDVTLADSNAILVYLALRYDEERRWLPRDPLAHAQVVRWFSVAADQLAHGPAAARRHAVFGTPLDVDQAAAMAAPLFGVIEAELSGRPFLVGNGVTLADLALYAYTAHAPEGGISLAPYPRIREWLGRIRALPRFVPFRATRTSVHA